MDVDDLDLRGVDTNGDGGTVDLLAVKTVNVDDPLAAVDLDNTALTALVGTAGDDNLVLGPDRQRPDVVLFPELLGQRSRHDLLTQVGRSREVQLPAGAAGGGDV